MCMKKKQPIKIHTEFIFKINIEQSINLAITNYDYLLNTLECMKYS